MSPKQKKELNPLIVEFMNDPLVTSQKSHKTLRNYGYNVQKFLERMEKHGKTLPNIQTTDLARFVQEMMDRRPKPCSSNTIKVNYWSIRTWIEWLNSEEKMSPDGQLIISDRKLKKFQKYYPDLPKNEEYTTRALNHIEIKSGLRKLHDPILKMLFWVGINYGIRAGEYINLTLQDVDLTNKLLKIRGSKRKKDRRIPVLDHHIQEWEKWFQTRIEYKQTNHKLVFFSSRGKFDIRNLQRYFNHMSELIYGNTEEIKENQWFTSHDLRRTFATNLYREGVNILTISRLMGHGSIQTTQIYLGITEKETFDDYRSHFMRARA